MRKQQNSVASVSGQVRVLGERFPVPCLLGIGPQTLCRRAGEAFRIS